MKKIFFLSAFLNIFLVPCAFSQAVILDPLPSASGSVFVTRHEKMEVGVVLPPSVAVAVNNWLALKMVDRSYQQNIYPVPSSMLDSINPFDEREIKIKAIITHVPTSTTYVREGFYYRNYNVISDFSKPIKNSWSNIAACPSTPTGCNNNPVSSKNVWREVVDPYDFRIRFAPNLSGLWKVSVTLAAYPSQGSPVMIGYPDLFFTCITAGNSYGGILNAGLLKLAPNKQYMQFTQTGATFIPIGQNSWDANIDGDLYGAQCKEVTREEYMDSFYKQLAHVKNAEGNFFRLGSNGYDFDIEWEKLGNYDTRMCTAWEIDSIINYAHHNGLYFIYDLISHHNFWDSWHCRSLQDIQTPTTPVPGGKGYWNHWPGNPYKPLLTPSSAIHPNVFDFFTNPTAKAFVKQKLRYIISRWGYATNIAAWEILDEPTELLSVYRNKSGLSDLQTQTNISNWFREMTDYIRINLADSHLITCSFPYYGLGTVDLNGTPNDTVIAVDMYDHPNIEIAQLHSYSRREDMNYKVRFLEVDAFLTNHTTPRNKALYFGEMGSRPEVIEKDQDAQFHNDNWATLMMGQIGPGLSWHFKYNSWNGSDSTIRALRRFTNNENLAGMVFKPYRSRSSTYQPYRFEAFYMVNATRSHAIGWIHNRSYWVQNYAKTFSPTSLVTLYTHDPNPPPTSPTPFISCPPCTLASCGSISRNCSYVFKPDNEYFLGFQSNWPDPTNPNNTGTNPCGCPASSSSILSYSLHFDTVFPLPASLYEIANLQPSTRYKVAIYRTRCKAQTPYLPYTTYEGCTNTAGTLTIQVPPTNITNTDWAFKLDGIATCPASEGASESSNQENQTTGAKFDFKVLPNPSDGNFAVELPVAIDLNESPYHLEVLNNNGKVIYETKMNAHKVLVSLPGLPSGNYAVRVYNEAVSLGKVILIQ